MMLSLAEDNTKSEGKNGPSVIFLPSHTTQKKWDDVLIAAKSGVVRTGTCAPGKVGPVIGLLDMDIGESEDSYRFCVSLPAVAKDESKFLGNFHRVIYPIPITH